MFSESSQGLDRSLCFGFFISTSLIYYNPELRQFPLHRWDSESQEEENVSEKYCCLFALIPCAIDIYSPLYCIYYTVYTAQCSFAGISEPFLASRPGSIDQIPSKPCLSRVETQERIQSAVTIDVKWMFGWRHVNDFILFFSIRAQTNSKNIFCKRFRVLVDSSPWSVKYKTVSLFRLLVTTSFQVSSTSVT